MTYFKIVNGDGDAYEIYDNAEEGFEELKNLAKCGNPEYALAPITEEEYKELEKELYWHNDQA